MRQEKKELAKNILLCIAAAGILATVIVLPGMACVLDLVVPKDKYEKQRIRRSIYGLQKKKLVKVYQKDGVEVVELTKEGKHRVFEYNIDDMVIKKPKRWDKKWRVVMFDIPEEKKRARDTLNYKLRDIGFVALQKSAFVFPYPCKKEIDFIVDYYSVQKHVIYLEAGSVSNEEELREKWGL